MYVCMEPILIPMYVCMYVCQQDLSVYVCQPDLSVCMHEAHDSYVCMYANQT